MTVAISICSHLMCMHLLPFLWPLPFLHIYIYIYIYIYMYKGLGSRRRPIQKNTHAYCTHVYMWLTACWFGRTQHNDSSEILLAKPNKHCYTMRSSKAESTNWKTNPEIRMKRFHPKELLYNAQLTSCINTCKARNNYNISASQPWMCLM